MCQIFEDKLPPIDDAIDYLTVPDDGLCPDVPTTILLKYFNYQSDSILLIAGVSPQQVASYMDLVYLRCKELERHTEEDAEAYGIDHLLFHPKSIFFVQQTDSSNGLAAWLSTLDPHDPYTLGLCCRKDLRMDKIIVPAIYPATHRG